VENFEKLSPRERSLHEKSFATNAGDPSYRDLAELAYRDGDADRKMHVPKGDVLHQFRKDVQEGKLPTVSWLVAPAKLSDHPDGPWFGAWYCSEAMSILTQNPEVWKKTIFILTYDENDGYFDHVPPFVAPAPGKPQTGTVSDGIDTRGEYVTLEQDRSQSHSGPRESPVGLGYRVPMVVASPWSRGGCVCSQVFDHTSVLQFLEKLLTHKTGKPIVETNISRWRRTVSGDLTSVFQPATAKESGNPAFLGRDPFFEQLDRAQSKPPPSGFPRLSDDMIAQIRQNPADAKWLARQEPGIRPSCALPYELFVDGALSADRSRITIRFHVSKDRFCDRSAGCPFTVYAITADGKQTIRNYAVIAGDKLEDSWPLGDFAGGKYHLRACGPNGFFREFIGDANDPRVELRLGNTPRGEVEIHIANRDADKAVAVQISDRSYKAADVKRSISAGETAVLTLDVKRSFYWCDFVVRIEGFDHFEHRFAGRVETGRPSFTDPAMGGVI
jgi:phospholipase C